MSSIDTSHPCPELSEGLTAALSSGAGLLRVTLERRGSAVLVVAVGEVDAFNVPTWKALLSEAAGATAAPGPLVVDANGLDFMACCSVAVLAEQSAECRVRGVELCLVSDQPLVARVIAAGRLDTELPLYPDVQAALDATSPLSASRHQCVEVTMFDVSGTATAARAARAARAASEN